MVVFTRYVEIGRVMFVRFGPLAGKAVAVVEVLDMNRALVAAPGIGRRQINLKHVALTDVVIDDLPRNARQRTLAKRWADAGVDAKVAKTAFMQRHARAKKRAEMNDFTRFKLMLEKKRRSHALREAANKAFAGKGKK